MKWKLFFASICKVLNIPGPFFGPDLAALRTLLSVSPSVRPSVCLSVRPSNTPFSQCRIIIKFAGVITNDKSDVQAKGQGQRPKVKVIAVKTQFSRFRTVTPVWICIWWWNDAQSLMLLGRVPYCFSRSFVKLKGPLAKKSSCCYKLSLNAAETKFMLFRNCQ